MNFNIKKIKYFEKPTGVDIYAEIYYGHKKVGWLEQPAYSAPAAYFDSDEIRQKFQGEAGKTLLGMEEEDFIEALIQDCERKYHGPEEYDRMLKEVLNG